MNSKSHYEILDGLRGVVALMVMVFHIFEAIAFAEKSPEQDVFHGFLGVDFFFVLSGFVMGYAYDDRWKDMRFSEFIRRRLIRLHPMVAIGTMIGLIAFLIQGRTNWNGEVNDITTVLISTLLALFILPILSKGLEVRGNTEMYPLNGPHWSLFYEYIGSLLYALVLRKMSTFTIKVLVITMAVLLLLSAIIWGNNTIAYGWSYTPYSIYGGALRLLFAYPAGLLLARIFRTRQIRKTNKPVFLITSLTLILLLAVPSITTITGWKYANAIYQFMCVAICFPFIIGFAARGTAEGWKKRVISYIGRLSYPLYAIHFPLVYLYIHWINTNQHPFGQWEYSTPIGVAVVNILIAILCLHFYDEPLRRYLNKKFVK